MMPLRLPRTSHTTVQNPKNQEEEDDEESDKEGDDEATASTTAVAEEIDYIGIYYYSSCSCQRRKRSPKSILLY